MTAGAQEVLCLGVSHKTAPVALRERLALMEGQTDEFLREAVATPAVSEIAVISTCNRTEIYVVSADPVAAETTALGLLAAHAGIRPTELAEVIYSPRNCDAARQLFRVAGGLESMILGEAEVQGQVRRAHDAALAAGSSGPMLNRLFGAALQTGKRTRTETGIGAGKASVASIAVDLARDVLGDLASRHVVIVGAGDTSELTAQALARQGVETVFVANRHADRARSVAARFGGEVVSLDALPEQLVAADIVVSSTSSPHPIIGASALEEVLAEREGRPLLLIDIAVPRDIDPAVGDLEGVRLYDIDGLQSVVSRTLSGREGEAVGAEAIVEDEIRRFARWMGQQDVRPTVAALREHGRDIVDTVLSENAGRWEGATERDLARIDAVARAVMQRLLHEPTIRLRESGHGRVALVRELFGMEDDGAVADVAPAEDDAAQDNVRRLHR